MWLADAATRTADFAMRAVKRCVGTDQEMKCLLASIEETTKVSVDLLIEALRRSPSLIPDFISGLEDKALALEILRGGEVRSNEDILCYFPSSLRDDREVAVAAVRRSGASLESASEELRADASVVILALATHALAFDCAALSLKSDPVFINRAISANPDVLWVAAGWLDARAALRAVRLFPLQALARLPPHLRERPEIWRTAVALHPLAFKFAPRAQCTREDIFSVVDRDPRVFTFLSLPWRQDASLALVALSGDGTLLGHPSVRGLWSNNRDAVLSAVTQNGLALEHASQLLRSDREVIYTSLRQNGLALAYVPVHLRGLGTFAEKAVEQNIYALCFVTGSAKERVVALVRRTGPKFPNLSLLQDVRGSLV